MAREMPGRALIWFKPTAVLRWLPCYDRRTFLLVGSLSVAGPSARQQSLRRDRGNGKGGRGRYLHACVHARKWRKIRRQGTSFFAGTGRSSLNFKRYPVRGSTTRAAWSSERVNQRLNINILLFILTKKKYIVLYRKLINSDWAMQKFICRKIGCY